MFAEWETKDKENSLRQLIFTPEGEVFYFEGDAKERMGIRYKYEAYYDNYAISEVEQGKTNEQKLRKDS